MERQVAGLRPIHLVHECFVSIDIETLVTEKFITLTVHNTRQEMSGPGYGAEEL